MQDIISFFNYLLENTGYEFIFIGLKKYVDNVSKKEITQELQPVSFATDIFKQSILDILNDYLTLSFPQIKDELKSEFNYEITRTVVFAVQNYILDNIMSWSNEGLWPYLWKSFVAKMSAYYLIRKQLLDSSYIKEFEKKIISVSPTNLQMKLNNKSAQVYQTSRANAVVESETVSRKYQPKTFNSKV